MEGEDQSIEWHKSRSFAEAFGHALNGLHVVFREEPNIQRHALFFIIAAIAARILEVPYTSVALFLLAAGLVICMEVVNSALEQLLDVIHPEYHRSVRRLKDIAAGAVLVAAVVALLIGVIIFVPVLAPLVLL